jgi:queuine tRNA-ribosyltransferase
LFVSNEILASRLNTIHNLAFYLGLMKSLRAAIAARTFSAFRESFLATR